MIIALFVLCVVQVILVGTSLYYSIKAQRAAQIANQCQVRLLEISAAQLSAARKCIPLNRL